MHAYAEAITRVPLDFPSEVSIKTSSLRLWRQYRPDGTEMVCIS